MPTYSVAAISELTKPLLLTAFALALVSPTIQTSQKQASNPSSRRSYLLPSTVVNEPHYIFMSDSPGRLIEATIIISPADMGDVPNINLKLVVDGAIIADKDILSLTSFSPSQNLSAFYQDNSIKLSLSNLSWAFNSSLQLSPIDRPFLIQGGFVLLEEVRGG